MLLGYPTTNKAYRVYNIRTCLVEELINVMVDDLKATYEQGKFSIVLSGYENESHLKWRLKNLKEIKRSTLLNQVWRKKLKKFNFNLRIKGSTKDYYEMTSLVIPTLE